MELFLKPELTRPPDFALFWEKTWKSLMSVESELHYEPELARGVNEHELLKLSFRSLGGVRVAGYAILWRDEEKRPLVVHSHGYGSSCSLQWIWARSGYNVVGVDIRGFGWSRAAAALRQARSSAPSRQSSSPSTTGSPQPVMNSPFPEKRCTLALP